MFPAMGRCCTTLVLFGLVTTAAYAQRGPADEAYQALKTNDYDHATAYFQEAIAASPDRVEWRKDLGYALLKAGETEAAREQFAEALRLNPADDRVALEYAYLCYETNQPATARREFEHLKNAGNAEGARAFENVDRPLREGIARWQQAIEVDPKNFSAHEELARLAAERDDAALAAEHYEAAWRLRPERRDLLIELGRAWKQLNRDEDATAAWIAAWRGGTPRVSEQARALLPDRYPYLSEFQKAMTLDAGNTQLRRDIAFQLGEPLEAEPALLQTRAGSEAPADAKTLGLRSLEKGYLPDAVKYLQQAHEADPQDYEVMLKLGWAFNILKDDRTALHWFDLARNSTDPTIAQEAAKAYSNLAPAFEPVRTTVWAFPIYSSRWHDLFGYAQAKTEVRLPGVSWLRPYLSVRLLGDVRGAVPVAFGSQYLSERSIIFGGGLGTSSWHGLAGWFEAGEALIYEQTPTEHRRFTPDYRGGLSYAKGFGHLLTGGSHGRFAETNMDGVFISRFGNDSILYSQNRAGYTLPASETAGVHAQLLWNLNLTADAHRQYWANYAETGPGLRFRFDNSPVLFSVNVLRGVYLVNEYNPRRPNYNELRVGLWYAFTH